jgi:polyhydroxyalkanoate synthesis regulator phasin
VEGGLTDPRVRRVESVHTVITDLVNRGQLSREDAQKVIHLIIGESPSLQEELEIELRRGTPGGAASEEK